MADGEGLTQEEIDELPSELELKFDPPLTGAVGPLEAIVFREPTLGALKEAARMKDEMQAVIMLLQQMTATEGVTPSVLEQMPARKFKRASAFAESFMQDARPIGSGD